MNCIVIKLISHLKDVVLWRLLTVVRLAPIMPELIYFLLIRNHSAD